MATEQESLVTVKTGHSGKNLWDLLSFNL